MRLVLLFFFAAGLGFLAAIPVGGSQIEAAKRAIHGRLREALLVVLGSVSSDVTYGVIALFGIAPLLELPGVTAFFMAAGAVLLWILAFLTIRESKKPHDLMMEARSLKSKGRSYLTGFSLAVTNPPMILSWLYAVTLARHLGLANPLTFSSKAIFIAGGALGLGSYLGALSLAMYKIKHFIPKTALGTVYRWLGIVLFLLSFFFIYSAVRYFLRGH